MGRKDRDYLFNTNFQILDNEAPGIRITFINLPEDILIRKRNVLYCPAFF
jgi:hypothetical protein